MFWLSIILLLSMDSFIQYKTTAIHGKNYYQPKFKVEGYEQFFLPKLDLKGSEHVYFNNDDIMELYKQKNIDPNNLDCNLKYVPDKDSVPVREVERKKSEKEVKENQQVEVKAVESVNLINRRPRPPMREKGFTHFIHVPFI